MSSQTWRRDDLDEALVESFFYTAYTTVRTANITPIMLAFMYAVLRLAGTRTLTQATLFNRMVLVAVGSLVGSVALRPNSPLAATAIAIVTIVGCALLMDAAYAFHWVSGNVLHPRPTLLLLDGRVLPKQLRRCLITEGKLFSELRSAGHSSLAGVHAVVLEPTGRFSVITRDAAAAGTELLHSVSGFAEYSAAAGLQAHAAAPKQEPGGSDRGAV